MSGPQVCIIGGGPAGLAAAIALRLAGASVTLFDSRQPPIDKACGEGLMPNTLAALAQLGVRIPIGRGHSLCGIQFIDRRARLTLDFPADLGLGLRRTQLHDALFARAAELEIDLCWNAKHVRVLGDSVITNTACFRPDLIVGADGLHSRVRRDRVFREKNIQTRFGFRQHFAHEPWSDSVEIYCGNRKQIYVTPIGRSEIGVALLTADPHERLDGVLPEFPALQERLRGASNTTRPLGAVTAMRTLAHVTQSRVALVGDASGSVDAITGEGIGLAVEQALALGEAYRSGSLAHYEHAHRRISRWPRCVARMLLFLSQNPNLQSAALHIADLFPMVANAMLAAYVRRRPSITGSGCTVSGSISLPNPERLNSQS